jgi:hypothetical protein
MDEFLKGGTDAVALVLYLLPGFLGMAVYDYLVEGPPREIFDRVVFALSMTLVSAVCVHLILKVPMIPFIVIKKDSNVFELVGSIVGSNMVYTTIASALISIILAALNNYGVILAAARAVRLTYKTSAVDVWQDVFYKFRGYWIRVTFVDGRELIGWPRYFSSVGQPRELFVADATWWLKDESGVITSIDVNGEGVYISDFTTVAAIALLS